MGKVVVSWLCAQRTRRGSNTRSLNSTRHKSTDNKLQVTSYYFGEFRFFYCVLLITFQSLVMAFQLWLVAAVRNVKIWEITGGWERKYIFWGARGSPIIYCWVRFQVLWTCPCDPLVGCTYWFPVVWRNKIFETLENWPVGGKIPSLRFVKFSYEDFDIKDKQKIWFLELRGVYVPVCLIFEWIIFESKKPF